MESGTIDSHPRETVAGSVIILLVIGTISVASFLKGGGGMYALPVLFLLLSAAIIKRQAYAVHLSLLFFLLFLASLVGASFRVWPFKVLVPLIIYTFIARIVPGLRRSTTWIKRGEMNRNVIMLISATAVLSALALIGWVLFINPDIQHHLDNIPELPLWAYPLVGAGFAILNAAMEEAIFRGVVMEATDSTVGPGYWSVGIQAVPFAAFHYQAGFPNGMSGFVMTFVYGVMLGALRRLSKGMLAPLLAHIAADAVIFTLLLFYFFQTSGGEMKS